MSTTTKGLFPGQRQTRRDGAGQERTMRLHTPIDLTEQHNARSKGEAYVLEVTSHRYARLMRGCDPTGFAYSPSLPERQVGG
jgi:hypothetical protein